MSNPFTIFSDIRSRKVRERFEQRLQELCGSEVYYIIIFEVRIIIKVCANPVFNNNEIIICIM